MAEEEMSMFDTIEFINLDGDDLGPPPDLGPQPISPPSIVNGNNLVVPSNQISEINETVPSCSNTDDSWQSATTFSKNHNNNT